MDDFHAVFTRPLLNLLLLNRDRVFLPILRRVAVVGHRAKPWRGDTGQRRFTRPPRSLISI